MGKTSYRQDTSPSLSFQRGGIMCTIVSANIFVKNRKENTEKKGKKCRMTSWFWETKKAEKVVVAELCGLKCLNNCRSNILIFSIQY